MTARLAFHNKTTLACLLAAALPALAQEAPAQRIEITGSAIKRIQSEGALPVQVIRREDIERTGATSVQELIQALPVMQGFTAEGDSVGGGGGGFTGASLRNQGEIRTLVLLNGRRVAPAGSQTLTGFSAAVNLNTLPLAAIDRVEVLTDGASALYGSDAIGGVVNFITRRNVGFVEVAGGLQVPKGNVGKESVASIVAGYGALDRDGFNLMFAASRNDRDPLHSTDRSYAKTGKFDFSANGRDYTFLLGSASPIPANVIIGPTAITPAYYPSLTCPAQTFFEPETGTCYYDFITQLEIYPETVRDNVFASAAKRLGEHTLTVDLLHSKSVTTARLAPPPGTFRITAASPFAQTVIDAAAAAGLGPVTFPVTARYRVADVGKRTTRDTHTADHLDLALDGTLAGWDYTASYTHSRAKYEEILAGGWVQQNPFLAALASGTINPFVGPGQQSAQAQALLDASILHGKFDAGTTTATQAQLKGSRPLFRLGGGDAMLALGATLIKEKFDKTPSTLAQGFDANGDPDTRFGDSSAIIPYSAERKVTGLFAEALLPFSKTLEVTPSVRHDRYDDFGSKTTWKLAARWQPTRQWLLRGSAGTGFKAPTVPQVNAATQSYGVTGGTYSCNSSPALAQIAVDLGAICPAGGGPVQFDVLASGNRDLKPETTKQWTLGARFEPNDRFSIGADYWTIRLDNQIGTIDESVVFADPTRFRTSFTTFVEPSTGDVLLAQFAGNVNLGKTETRGVDFDAIARFPVGDTRWTSRFTATYLIKDRFEVVPGDGFLTDLGRYENGVVAFRWKARLSNTVDIGAWTHNVSFNYQSGYRDDPTEVLVRGTLDYETVQRKVSEYWTLDWQSRWQVNKQLSLVVGANNLLDEDPPLSITVNGGGQMVGYDSRYYDARGRTVYLRANYRF
jgi:iron complex outermembrane receptor protein